MFVKLRWLAYNNSMRQKIILAGTHILLWVGMYILLSPIPLKMVSISYEPLNDQLLSLFLLYGFIFNILLIYTYAHLALPTYLRQRKASYLFSINVIYLLLFSLLETVFDYFFFDFAYSYYEYAGMPESFQRLSATNLIFNLFMLLAANIYGFAYAWFQGQSERRALEKEKLKAELSALKHQIHPHFLFNILNGLYGLAYKNDDEPTAEGIAKLSQMMRYMLYESNDEKVALEKEIQYIEHYIDLQRLRTNSKTRIKWSVSGDPRGKQVVPLIFIPFIENAFKFGVSTVHEGEIVIHLQITDQKLIFWVQNTIPPPSGMQTGTRAGGLGLRNVKKRLKLVYGHAFKLNINEGKEVYKVKLRLPL